MPPEWWLYPPTKADKAPERSHYLLAALVHKNNPDVVSNPVDAPAGATSVTIRKKTAEEQSASIVAAQSAQGLARGKMEESMMSVKTIILQKNVELQQMEGIKKQLNLLERFKLSFVIPALTVMKRNMTRL